MSINLNLELERLHEAARKKTNLDNFGHPEYLEGLTTLLESYQTDFELNVETLLAVNNALADLLIGRLYTENGWTLHPGVTNDAILGPLVIAGFARTGTTALHKLLSCDPQFQVLELWLGRRPMVRPKRAVWHNQPEYIEANSQFERGQSEHPSFATIHTYNAAEAEECGFAMKQSFQHWVWAIEMPTYLDWLTKQNRQRSYDRYSNVLRLIGAADLNKRWLLKDPFHLMDLDLLMKSFPSASIVQTHRDPVDAIPSWYSLHKHTYHHAFRPKRVDSVASSMCEFWRTAIDRSRLHRKHTPSLILDVEQSDIADNPLAVVRSIYKHFNFSLSSTTECKMKEWLATRGPRPGLHKRNLNSFKVTSDEIKHLFADYRSLRGYPHTS